MREGKDRTRLVMLIMGAIIVLLLLFLLYVFVVQPQYYQFVDEKRLEGIEYYVGAYVVPQIEQTGYVQIPVGNQSLILVPYVPPQA